MIRKALLYKFGECVVLYGTFWGYPTVYKPLSNKRRLNRILIKNLCFLDGEQVFDHIWILVPRLHEWSKVKFGTRVAVRGTVCMYRKINGFLDLGMRGYPEVKIIDRRRGRNK